MSRIVINVEGTGLQPMNDTVFIETEGGLVDLGKILPIYAFDVRYRVGEIVTATLELGHMEVDYKTVDGEVDLVDIMRQLSDVFGNRAVNLALDKVS